MQINQYEQVLGENKFKSEKLLSYSVANIVLELLKNEADGELIELENGKFSLLLQHYSDSFLNEITRQYVVTARAKGLSERRVLYGHVFRNAMLLVVSGIPQAFISVFFAGSLLIEVIFSLDGLGRMSYEAAVSRDYPVVFGSLFIFTLFGLLIKLVGDLCYTLVDPRIDFAARNA